MWCFNVKHEHRVRIKYFTLTKVPASEFCVLKKTRELKTFQPRLWGEKRKLFNQDCVALCFKCNDPSAVASKVEERKISSLMKWKHHWVGQKSSGWTLVTMKFVEWHQMPKWIAVSAIVCNSMWLRVKCWLQKSSRVVKLRHKRRHWVRFRV